MKTSSTGVVHDPNQLKLEFPKEHEPVYRQMFGGDDAKAAEAIEHAHEDNDELYHRRRSA